MPFERPQPHVSPMPTSAAMRSPICKPRPIGALLNSMPATVLRCSTISSGWRREDAIVITLRSNDATPSPALAVATVRTGKHVRIVIPSVAGPDQPARNPALLKLIAQAFEARREIEAGGSFDAVAARLDIGRESLADMIRMSYLAPSIVEAIVAGRQPATLTRKQIVTTNRIPSEWSQQRTVFGFA